MSKTKINFLISLAILIILISCFFIQNFRIDASSDTLVAQNDEDFEYFNKYSKLFKSENFLVIAVQNNNKIASALNFLSITHLYGRLWGSKLEVPYLHFELCYYQAIDYAIEHQIKYVEAGAQGEHKLSRGYLPQKTWSAHWIKEKEFSNAISKFLDQETRMINIHKEDLEALAPYKN